MIKPLFIFLATLMAAQPATQPQKGPEVPAKPPPEPLAYRIPRTPTPPKLDGRGDDPAWERAPWTPDFVDIEGDARPKPYHRTRAKMLWDDQNLYVLAELEEPHVWGTLTEHNSIIFHDNDFEIFIDPDGDRLKYYEFEINALGTTMELTMPKPYKDGGNYTFTSLEGLKSAVHVEGTVNDPSDTDRKWTVEVAIPHAGLAKLAAGVREGGPRARDVWRINFSRVQWRHRIENGKYVKVPKTEHPEENWVWSPQGKIDMHMPERWGRATFGE